MKATEQYFPVVLFIMLYKVVLTFESVDEILKCYHLVVGSRRLVQHYKQYHRRVLLNSFFLNCHTLGFHSQIQKLKPPCSA